MDSHNQMIGASTPKVLNSIAKFLRLLIITLFMNYKFQKVLWS